MNTTLQIKIVVRLLRLIFSNGSWFIVHSYISYFQKLRKKSGLKYAIAYYKAVKLHCTRYVCGKPLFENSAGVAINHYGLPKKFPYLKGLLDDPKVCSVALTLLTYTRSIQATRLESLKIKPDYSTITAPYKGRNYTIPTSFIKEFVKVYNLSLPKHTYTLKDHYVSVKASPNGQATLSSLWSPRLLSGDQIRWILKIVDKNFVNNIMKMVVLAWVNKKLPFQFNVKDHHQHTGRLSIIKDPELKMRVIAMVDYLSQFTLKPIHDGILSLLKAKLPQDRTFTQDPFNKWSDNNDSFFSLDLSAATDRFPIVLQKKLLAIVYNDYEFANCWANLLSKREFLSPEGDKFTYSVGQPMGAYSSWAAFTLTHHLVVAWAAKLSGFEAGTFKDYILLGDDIVIKHNVVANRYIALMTKFGVDISLQKTHISKNMYEFAKRWIRSGVEVTGVPLKGILSNWANVQVVFLELFTYIQRNPINRIPTIDLTCLLYKGIPFNKRTKSSVAIRALLYDFNQALRHNFGLATYDELRSYWAAKTRNHISMVPGQRVLPSLLRATLSTALLKNAAMSRLDIHYSIRNFNAYFNLLIRTQNDDYLCDKELFQQFALFHGFRNHIYSSREAVTLFLKDTITLDTAVQRLRIDNFDKVANMFRNKSQRVSTLTKMWQQSFSLLFIKEPKAYVKFSAEVRRIIYESNHT
jgi:hypothetical protein